MFEQCTNKSGSTVVQVTALSDDVDLSLVSKGKNLNQMYGASPSTIDKYSRVIFPVCFTCFHLMYWLIYLHISDEIAEGLTLHNPNPWSSFCNDPNSRHIYYVIYIISCNNLINLAHSRTFAIPYHTKYIYSFAFAMHSLNSTSRKSRHTVAYRKKTKLNTKKYENLLCIFEQFCYCIHYKSYRILSTQVFRNLKVFFKKKLVFMLLIFFIFIIIKKKSIFVQGFFLLILLHHYRWYID